MSERERDETPFEMMRNAVTNFHRYADAQAEDPLRAQALGLGARGRAAAELAAMMAIISIAEDLHRIAAHLTCNEEMS